MADFCTTFFLQETLRSEFSERTLVAVAHRLHTIIVADRVLVMEKGRAVEYGAPAQLLELEDGHFAGTGCCWCCTYELDKLYSHVLLVHLIVR